MSEPVSCNFCARREYCDWVEVSSYCGFIPYHGILADFQIKELIDSGIIQAEKSKVQPTSIDLHLGETFFYEKTPDPRDEIVVKANGDHVGWAKELHNCITLDPGQPCLASVKELVALPDWLTMELRMTSTEGRDCIQHILAVWCFTADTEIAMWSGPPKKIVDVKEGDWVVSIGSDGRVKPGKVEKSFMSGVTNKVATVDLDNGKRISCTPDHKFMLRNGEYVSAMNLKSGDSLMPLYQRESYGRRQYYSPRNSDEKLAHQYKGKWEYAHRLVKVSGVTISEVESTPMYDLTIKDHHNFAIHDGCFVHNCDPGFEGAVTLELQNVSQNHVIVLSAGDRICQAIFHKHMPVERKYEGRYKGDMGTQPAKSQK